MLFKAIEFAAQSHRGQFRKKTRIPYIIHPLNVMKILIEQQCREEVVVAGILHDVVEDTPVSLAEIKDRFGAEVARMVETVSEPDKSDSWENRKQHTLEAFRSASAEVLMIACADKLDNIRSMRLGYEQHGESFWERFNRPKEKQAWYYCTLAQIFQARRNDIQASALVSAFQTEVSNLFGAVNQTSPDGRKIEACR